MSEQNSGSEMLCFEKEISEKDSSYIYERESNCPEDRLVFFPEYKNKKRGLETVRVFSLKRIVELVLFGESG